MERTPLRAKINILTEAPAGEMYLLEADDYNELVNDCLGDHRLVPPVGAKVYFASYAGKPINPYEYTDFISLIKLIRAELFKGD